MYNTNRIPTANRNRNGILAVISFILASSRNDYTVKAYSSSTSKIKRNKHQNDKRSTNRFVVMPARADADHEKRTNTIFHKLKKELFHGQIKEEQGYDFNELQSLQQYKEFESDLMLPSTYDPLNLSNGMMTSDYVESDMMLPSNYDPLDLSNGMMTSDYAMNEDEKDKREILFAQCLVLMAAALYGTNFTFVKLLGEYVPIGISSALRFGMAALVTLPWLFAPSNNDKHQSSLVILTGMEVGMYNSLGYLAQAEGLQTTDASKSAFICSLAVVFVPILDALSGKAVSLQKTLGAIIAVAGVGLLELGDQSSLSLSHGDMLSLIQPMVFGIGFWRMEDAMHKYPSEAKRLTAGQLLSVALASILYCGAGLDGCPPPNLNEIMSYVTNPATLTSLFWTGIVTTALTIYMETIALKTLTAAETTLLFSSEPLWGAAFAAFFVGERFGVSAALGAALIVSGCVYSNVELNKEEIDLQDDKAPFLAP